MHLTPADTEKLLLAVAIAAWGAEPARIVCFGDSNTWAVDAGTFNRMEPEASWPGILGKNLGDGFRVIQVSPEDE